MGADVSSYVTADGTITVPKLAPDVTDLIAAAAADPTAITIAVNGLVTAAMLRDLGFDPDVHTELRILPDAQPWQAGRAYSVEQAFGFGSEPSRVSAVGNAAVRYKAEQVKTALSGSVEPVWPTDDTEVSDNEVNWSNKLYLGPWSAGLATTTPFRDVVLAVGAGWLNVGGSGTTGGVPPAWGSVGYGETVADGDAVWLRLGPVTTWAADTRYALLLSADRNGSVGPFALPTALNGHVYQFADNLRRYAVAGDAQPAFSDAPANSGLLVEDDDILWREDTPAGDCVVTGLPAPSGLTTISLRNAAALSSNAGLTLLDAAGIEAVYGSDVLPDADQAVNAGSDVVLNDGEQASITYRAASWYLGSTITPNADSLPVYFDGPTSDPGVAGQLWSDNGVVRNMPLS